MRHAINLAAAAGLVPPMWVKLPLGFEMWLDVSDFMQRSILIYETWSPEVTRVFQRFLKSGDHVVDIGANVGYFSLLAATLVGPAGHVTSFEPNPTIYGQLQANIARNRLPVVAHQAACSDHDGEVGLYISDGWNSGECSFSSLNASGTRAQKISCVVADNVLEDRPPPNFIKIDVEGAEMLVLKGLSRTLSAAHPALCLEVDDRKLVNMGSSSREIYGYLSSFGYTLTRLGVDLLAQ